MLRQRFLKAATVVILSAICLLAAQPSVGARETANTVRIGVYDNRSIAVAYAASHYNRDLLLQKMTAHQTATQSGDQAMVKALGDWGKQQQKKLHFQGFGRVPVDDLIEPVKDQLADVAAAQRLSAIVMACDFTAANVEVVDVTDHLVELFNPTAKTREVARKIRDADPVSLTRLAEVAAND